MAGPSNASLSREGKTGVVLVEVLFLAAAGLYHVLPAQAFT